MNHKEQRNAMPCIKEHYCSKYIHVIDEKGISNKTIPVKTLSRTTVFSGSFNPAADDSITNGYFNKYVPDLSRLSQSLN